MLKKKKLKQNPSEHVGFTQKRICMIYACVHKESYASMGEGSSREVTADTQIKQKVRGIGGGRKSQEHEP